MKQEYVCANCGKAFCEYPSQIKNPLRAFCSRECYRNMGRKTVECQACKKKFVMKKSSVVQFCSRQCKESTLKRNKKCTMCGKPIVGYGRTYCSSVCRRRFSRVEKTCNACGKTFLYPKSKKGTSWIGKFCSWTCFVKKHPRRKGKIDKKCEICGKPFAVYPRHREQRFCSSVCFGRHLYSLYKENPELVERIMTKRRRAKTGWHVSKTSGKRFMYHSSYELIRMKFLDKIGLKWEKNTSLAIPYVAIDGRARLYIPDFIVEENGQAYLEESKGWERKNDPRKYAVGRQYANEHGAIFHVMRTQKQNRTRPSELKESA